MIVVKIYFTPIYFYSSTRVFVAPTSMYWSSTGLLSSLYFRSTGSFLTFNPVLQGDKCVWLWIYKLSDCCTDPVTYIRREKTLALGDTVIRSLPGTYGF